MRAAGLICGLAALVCSGGLAGAETAGATAGPIEEKQSEPSAAAASIRVFRQPPCGEKADLYFCGSFNSQVYPGVNRGTVKTPNMAVSAPKGASVTVTWTGSLYCESYFAEPFAAKAEYVVVMQIQSERISPIDYNEGGSEAFGRGTPNPKGAQQDLTRSFELQPVTLTRTFVAARSGVERYFAVFNFEQRTWSGGCNVNGGGMTATVAR